MSEASIVGRRFDRNMQFKVTLVIAFAIMLLMLITIASLFFVEVWEQVAQRSILVAGIIGLILVLLTVGFEAETIALIATFLQIALAALTPLLLGTKSMPEYLLIWLDNSHFSWSIVLTIYAATTIVWIVSVIDLWNLRTGAKKVFQWIKQQF